MKLPITRTMQAALDWLAERGGRHGVDGAPFRADTWRKLITRGFVREDDFGHLEIVPIDPLLQLSVGDIEDAALATRRQAEKFKIKIIPIYGTKKVEPWWRIRGYLGRSND